MRSRRSQESRRRKRRRRLRRLRSTFWISSLRKETLELGSTHRHEAQQAPLFSEFQLMRESFQVLFLTFSMSSHV